MKTSPIIHVLATLALLGCSGDSDNSLFCDETTDCSSNAEATFCDIDKAFAGTGLKNECITPPSATACNRVEACADSNLHCSDESIGAIGECVPCVDASHCPGVGEVCNMTTNECEALPCTVDAAGDDICFAAAPAKPYCVEADSCGECRPEMDDCAGNAANAQVCDAENFACRGCQTNNECTLSDLCDTVSTECAAEPDLLYVVATGGSDAGTCTRAAPCATIQYAIDQVMNTTRNTILVGAGSYSEPLDIDNKTVNIIGQGVVIVNPDINGSGRALTAQNSAVVSVENIDILPHEDSDAGSDAVYCDNATLTLSNAEIRGARDMGVLAENNCTLTLTQSTVSGNDGGGVKIDNSNFDISNSFIIRNGTNTSPLPGILVLNPSNATQRFDFNTVAGNQIGGLAQATNFDCGVTTALIGTGNVFYQGQTEGVQPSLRSTNCSFEYSDIEGQTPSGTNMDVVPMFVMPVAGPTGDYHLAANSPLIGAAAGATTVPDEDVDGDARPAGAADIGADQYTAN